MTKFNAPCATVINLVTTFQDLIIETNVLIPLPTFIKVPIAAETGPIAKAIPAKIKTVRLPSSSKLANQFATLVSPFTASVTNGNKLSVILPNELLKASFKDDILPLVVCDALSID